MKQPTLQLGMGAHHGGRYYAFWSVADGRWHLRDTDDNWERTYTTREACVRALRQLAQIMHVDLITVRAAQSA
jgi:hypothetical protein